MRIMGRALTARHTAASSAVNTTIDRWPVVPHVVADPILTEERLRGIWACEVSLKVGQP